MSDNSPARQMIIVVADPELHALLGRHLDLDRFEVEAAVDLAQARRFAGLYALRLVVLPADPAGAGLAKDFQELTGGRVVALGLRPGAAGEHAGSEAAPFGRVVPRQDIEGITRACRELLDERRGEPRVAVRFPVVLDERGEGFVQDIGPSSLLVHSMMPLYQGKDVVVKVGWGKSALRFKARVQRVDDAAMGQLALALQVHLDEVEARRFLQGIADRVLDLHRYLFDPVGGKLAVADQTVDVDDDELQQLYASYKQNLERSMGSLLITVEPPGQPLAQGQDLLAQQGKAALGELRTRGSRWWLVPGLAAPLLFAAWLWLRPHEDRPAGGTNPVPGASLGVKGAADLQPRPPAPLDAGGPEPEVLSLAPDAGAAARVTRGAPDAAPPQAGTLPRALDAGPMATPRDAARADLSTPAAPAPAPVKEGTSAAAPAPGAAPEAGGKQAGGSLSRAGLLARGRGLARQRKLAEAVAVLEQALALGDGTDVRRLLADLYRRQALPAKAAASYRVLGELAPDVAYFPDMEGRMLLELGDGEGACKAFQRAVAVAPDYSVARAHLAKHCRK